MSELFHERWLFKKTLGSYAVAPVILVVLALSSSHAASRAPAANDANV